MQEQNPYKQIALYACVYFTVTTFLISSIYWVLNTGNITSGFNLVALLLVFPFSCLFSAANWIYRHTDMQKWVRVFIHYTLTVGGAFIFLFLPNKAPTQKASASLLLFLVFTVLYAIIMGIVLGISARIHRVKREASQYRSVYRKK